MSARREFKKKYKMDLKNLKHQKKTRSSSQIHKRHYSLKSLKYVKRVNTSDKDDSNLIYSLEGFESKMSKHQSEVVRSERSEAIINAKREIKYIHDYFSKVVRSGYGNRNVEVHKKEIATAFNQFWRPKSSQQIDNSDKETIQDKKIHVRFQVPDSEEDNSDLDRSSSHQISTSQSFHAQEFHSKLIKSPSCT
ncbi:unnamed protein product [Moneuplotes crassus]|uniref:Uncharacterized protein n=1 Tax=Euplotes crassus TaxID=5936 RepID=A0AAD1Y1L1_EUPCR|nr:unnamed protein product [Moneuplotes crassus]